MPSLQGTLAEANGFLIHGLLVLERGFIFSCMILSALCAMLIDRRFAAAAIWSLLAAAFSFVGVMHAYQLSGNNVDFLFLGVPPREGAATYPAWGIGACYVAFALMFWGAEWWTGGNRSDE
jgi:AGZA family xanthine/uracil permease-like MFS transporter